MNLPMTVGSAPQLPALWDEDEAPALAGGLGLKRAMAICGGLFLVLFALAAFVPMGGAVIGSGAVGVDTRVKRIAHPTGGVIGAILVTNGERVREGQLLMRLDDRVTGADALYSGLTVEQLLAQRARLEAERLNRPGIAFPPELTAANTASARQAIADETQMFRIRSSATAQQRAQLGARVAQYLQQIQALQSQISSVRQQRALIEPERQGVKDLWDKQLVTINRMNQLERTAVDLDGSAGQLYAQIAEARAHITEAQQQIVQVSQQRQVDAGNELSQVNTALNQQRLRSVAASDQQNRSEIRAPYSGTVEKIAFSAVGDVVRPAEAIMEIVPDRDVMVVEAAISPGDVDQVVKGQPARVRFSSFNRAATPEISGRVIYVATDRSENTESHASFYTVRIALDLAAVKREGLDLRSGMPAEVYVETGSRSLLSYVTKPIRDQIARAFRDN
jgi:HlyD family type I secretion membrane fusion protein